MPPVACDPSRTRLSTHGALTCIEAAVALLTDYRDEFLVSAVSTVCKSANAPGADERLCALVAHGAHIDTDLNSPLVQACAAGGAQVAARLLALGCDANHHAPVIAAFRSGSAHTVRVLLEAGAVLPEVATPGGVTAERCYLGPNGTCSCPRVSSHATPAPTATASTPDPTTAAIASPTPVCASDTPSKTAGALKIPHPPWRPWLQLSSAVHDMLTTALMMTQVPRGCTGIGQACNHGDSEVAAEMLKLALAAKSPLHARDSAGRTPLHAAAFQSTVKLLNILISLGAQVMATDIQGNTPLHCAAQGSSLADECVKILVRSGARVGVCNLKKKLPIDLASNYLVKAQLLQLGSPLPSHPLQSTTTNVKAVIVSPPPTTIKYL
eukprot:TRINITY_DN18720_c0_g1_i1.p1 TRINITY_DN18720_c0_g1~~TRINITY_DN18720_c0_g1_i1.p1  ORF type:complete len:382 (+),score=74.31 TRINITY_DN18720_c0_g1_i1:459-1604(+)